MAYAMLAVHVANDLSGQTSYDCDVPLSPLGFLDY